MFCIQELTLLDTPALMTLLDERPSGKLCVTYQKLTVVDAIDEITATTQRIPNLDISKVTDACTLLVVVYTLHANMRERK